MKKYEVFGGRIIMGDLNNKRSHNSLVKQIKRRSIEWAEEQMALIKEYCDSEYKENAYVQKCSKEMRRALWNAILEVKGINC